MGGGVWYTGRRGIEIAALAFAQRDLQPVAGFQTAAVSSKPLGYSGALCFARFGGEAFVPVNGEQFFRKRCRASQRCVAAD